MGRTRPEDEKGKTRRAGNPRWGNMAQAEFDRQMALMKRYLLSRRPESEGLGPKLSIAEEDWSDPLNSSLLSKGRRERGELVNSLSLDELEACVVWWIRRKRLVFSEESLHRGPVCHYGGTQFDSGPREGRIKYPVFHLKPVVPRLKLKQSDYVLVHMLWWRYVTGGRKVAAGLQISHRDIDPKRVSVVQELRTLNESRKYCHMFGFFKAFPGEEQPRCPHLEHPCTGPSE